VTSSHTKFLLKNRDTISNKVYDLFSPEDIRKVFDDEVCEERLTQSETVAFVGPIPAPQEK